MKIQENKLTIKKLKRTQCKVLNEKSSHMYLKDPKTHLMCWIDPSSPRAHVLKVLGHVWNMKTMRVARNEPKGDLPLKIFLIALMKY